MIVLYAFGGGWGHLTRAVSLARIEPDRFTILTNSPYTSEVHAAEPRIAIEGFTANNSAQVAIRLRDLAPEVLVVDTFPRGLAGELADVLPTLAARKILVHRDLTPEYVEWADLRSFVARCYDLVLVPGANEGTAFTSNAIVTKPWLVRDVDNLAKRPVQVLICASGNAEELDWYGEVASRIPSGIEFRCIAPVRPAGCPTAAWLPYWPAIEWIAGAGVVIGSGGYNTVYECAASGVPLIAKPWPRKYDRQARRAAAQGAICVDTPADAVAAAMRLLGAPHKLQRGLGGPPLEALALLL